MMMTRLILFAYYPNSGRIHPLVRANYLASPPLVVAYALAGTTNIDFETEPIGTGSDGKPVFLRDIWPSHKEVQEGAIEERDDGGRTERERWESKSARRGEQKRKTERERREKRKGSG